MKPLRDKGFWLSASVQVSRAQSRSGPIPLKSFALVPTSESKGCSPPNPCRKFPRVLPAVSPGFHQGAAEATPTRRLGGAGKGRGRGVPLPGGACRFRFRRPGG